jgi:hypothetical protein
MGTKAQTPIARSLTAQWEDTIKIEEQGNQNFLKEQFSRGDIVMMCDGSTKNGCAAAAWRLTTLPTIHSAFIQGSAQSPGTPSNLTSHRAECTGILGGLYTLHKIHERWGITEGLVTIMCDNISALKHSLSISQHPNISKLPDFDLIQAIRYYMHSDTTYMWRLVKGHQPANTDSPNLETYLNNVVDHLARSRRLSIESMNPDKLCEPVIPHELWSVTIHQKKIHSNLDEFIYEHTSAVMMRAFWHKQHRIDKNVFDDVSWDAVHLAMRSVPSSRRRWITKHVSGECGVYSVLVKRGMTTSSACRRCGEEETTHHVWQCQHSSSTKLWESSIEDLRACMSEHSTDPTIVSDMCNGLLSWQHQRFRLLGEDTIGSNQDIIGWKNVLEGCLSKSWLETQTAYLLSTKSTQNPLRWLSAIIKKLWQIYVTALSTSTIMLN